MIQFSAVRKLIINDQTQYFYFKIYNMNREYYLEMCSAIYKIKKFKMTIFYPNYFLMKIKWDYLIHF